jgi:hypothetical protein
MALARVALGAVALAGCYAGFDSEEGQLRLVPDDDVFTEPYLGLFPQNNPLLEGTRLCLEVTCSPLDPTCPVELELGDCFQQSVEGGTLLGPGCALADAAGTLTWRFVPDLAGCGGESLAYAPVADQLTFQVVPPAEVTAALYQWAEAAAESSLAPEVGASFPTDWTVGEGEPFQVVVGGSLRLPIVLTHPDYSGAVVYDTTAVEVRVVDVAGTAAVESPEPGWLQVVPSPGYVGEVEVTIGGTPQLAGQVVGVPPAVASLELVPAFAVSDGQRLPVAARAVARDASGALLRGGRVDGARWGAGGGAGRRVAPRRGLRAAPRRLPPAARARAGAAGGDAGGAVRGHGRLGDVLVAGARAPR